MSGETRICPKCLHDEMKRDGSEARKDAPSKQKYRCLRCDYSTVHPLDEDDPRLTAGKTRFRTSLPRKEVYIITCAQNATDPHPTLNSLKTYCHEEDAELIVIGIRYTNPTSHWGANAKSQDWWCDEVKPHLFSGRRKIHKHCTLLGDIMTQLTAARPVQGYETITGANTAIIGHPKQELLYSATPQQKLPKATMSTGACTIRNYIPGKAGAKGAHHHTYGAIVVEKDGDKFHFRQLNALDDGTFMDVSPTKGRVLKYCPNGTVEKTSGRVPLMVVADLHERFVSPTAVKATFIGKRSMRSILNPTKIAWHDVMDGYSCNPHERDNPFLAYARQRYEYHDIKKEIESCAGFMDTFASGDVENYIVASNHEDFLARWMSWADWRKDLPNAEFYLETALAMVRAAKITEAGYQGLHPFPHWMKQFVKKANIKYLGVDESFTVHGIEAGFHGHRGPDGARGSIEAFGKIGVRTIIAHLHRAGIRNGVFQVGTMSRLSMDYTAGPSSWMNTNGVVYENGKRCLLNAIGEDWRRK